MIERIEINLLPAEYRVHKRSFKLKREVVYPLLGAAIIGVGLLSWTVTLQSSISQYNNEIRTIKQQISLNKPIQNEINKLREDKITIQEKIRALERISINREKWVRLMEELSQRLPDYTWILSVREDGSTPPILHIEGRTFSFPEVANYMSSLKESVYVTSVDLSNIEQIDTKEKLYRFEISCVINPDVQLDNEQKTTVAVNGL
ncbi:MAG: PilN domain-containing protein [Chitinispirillaceae bacterium]|nr:PilN domain-containing protein [Chitinispirillaceae bacterium]